MIFAQLHFAAILSVVYSISIIEPVVHTDLGRVRGSVFKTVSGRDYFAFRGIPYAQAPIADLRWKPPVAMTSWPQMEYDARKDGPICPQSLSLSYNKYLVNGNMSEDCLRLNVYTKNLNLSSSNPKAVIVFIHGGSFLVGGSTHDVSMPTYIMDRDIVFVSINYRLGILGFLSTGTAEISGNAGMKDQVMALRWIQTHISNFGGDPNRVTIWGHSAGAMSVNLHLVSPMSAGLFHRAIIMSGTATVQNNLIRDEQNDLIVKYGLLQGCENTYTAYEVYKCIKDMDYEYLVRYQDETNGYYFCPLLLFLPVVEPDLGQERFLTDNPIKSFRSGKWNRVPIITGFVKDEFAQLANYILQQSKTEFYNNFDNIAPGCLMYSYEKQNLTHVNRILKKRFLPPTLEKFNNLTKFQVVSIVKLFFIRKCYYHNPNFSL